MARKSFREKFREFKSNFNEAQKEQQRTAKRRKMTAEDVVGITGITLASLAEPLSDSFIKFPTERRFREGRKRLGNESDIPRRFALSDLPKGVSALSERDSLEHIHKRSGRPTTFEGVLLSRVDQELMGPTYDPKSRILLNTERAQPELVAKTVGDARAHKKLKGFYPFAQNTLRASRKVAPYATVGSIGFHMGSLQSNNEKHQKALRKARNISLGLAGVPAALSVGLELPSLIHARRSLARRGLLTPERSKNLWRAFVANTSPETLPLLSAGATIGLSSLIKRHKDKRNKKKGGG